MGENGLEEVLSRTRKGDRHKLSLEPGSSRYTDRGIGQLPSLFAQNTQTFRKQLAWHLNDLMAVIFIVCDFYILATMLNDLHALSNLIFATTL